MQPGGVCFTKNRLRRRKLSSSTTNNQREPARSQQRPKRTARAVRSGDIHTPALLRIPDEGKKPDQIGEKREVTIFPLPDLVFFFGFLIDTIRAHSRTCIPSIGRHSVKPRFASDFCRARIFCGSCGHRFFSTFRGRHGRLRFSIRPRRFFGPRIWKSRSRIFEKGLERGQIGRYPCPCSWSGGTPTPPGVLRGQMHANRDPFHVRRRFIAWCLERACAVFRGDSLLNF